MQIERLGDEIWSIDELLSEKNYRSVMDEFKPMHNNICFLKKDNVDDTYPGMRHISYPKWGQIIKHEEKGQGLGDNLNLIRIGEIIKYTVQKILRKNVYLNRVNTNIQFPLQEATLHQDGGQNSWSVVLFVCSMWDPEWGGDFVCLENQRHVYVPYKPNNAVLINGFLVHRGAAPNYFAPMERVSIAWTYQEVNNDRYEDGFRETRNGNPRGREDDGLRGEGFQP